jgi:hypothetical protein
MEDKIIEAFASLFPLHPICSSNDLMSGYNGSGVKLNNFVLQIDKSFDSFSEDYSFDIVKYDTNDNCDDNDVILFSFDIHESKCSTKDIIKALKKDTNIKKYMKMLK